MFKNQLSAENRAEWMRNIDAEADAIRAEALRELRDSKTEKEREINFLAAADVLGVTVIWK